jgi:hypothetical protein
MSCKEIGGRPLSEKAHGELIVPIIKLKMRRLLHVAGGGVFDRSYGQTVMGLMLRPLLMTRLRHQVVVLSCALIPLRPARWPSWWAARG